MSQMRLVARRKSTLWKFSLEGFGMLLTLMVLPAQSAWSQTQATDITRCGLTIEREGSPSTITDLTIRLTDMPGLDNIPIGDQSDMMAWTSEILRQAEKREGGGGDITIRIKDTSLYYGSKHESDHALISSALGHSWNPATCGRRTSNPNVGSVSIQLTEKMLEGQFAATLITCDGRTAINRASIGGTFQCALPILYDPKYSFHVTEAEALRAQAEAIWLANAGGDGGSENLRRALPFLPGGISPAPPSAPKTAEEEWDCDCSCPTILDYSQEHRCRIPCGPEFRYEACRADQAEEISEVDPAEGGSEDDPCVKWQKQLSGEGVPPEYAQFLQNMFQQMGKACEDMSPEEQAALEKMLEAMAPAK